MSQIYSDYDPFAWLYNQKWGDYADRVLPLLEAEVLLSLPKGARILDVCCGTGQLAAILTEKGFAVTGVDGSKAMLAYAGLNAPECTFIHADARAFNAGTGYAAAFSTFDSLNHILEAEGLAQVFTNVYAALAPGGVFFFDLNTAEGYQERWNGSSWGNVEEGLVFLVRNSFDIVANLATFDMCIFTTAETDDLWKRTDLHLSQRSYPDKTILQLLADAGFSSVQSTDPWGPGRKFYKAVK